MALAEAHVIVREVYTLTELSKGCDDLRDNQSQFVHTKTILMERLGQRIKFGKENRKAGLCNLVTDIHKFGHGPVYTNDIFIQDK